MWQDLLNSPGLPVPQLALLGALALLFTAVLVRALVRTTRHRVAVARQKCRWKRDRGRTGALSGWQCRTCGVEAYSADRKAPKECKRFLREGRL